MSLQSDQEHIFYSQIPYSSQRNCTPDSTAQQSEIDIINEILLDISQLFNILINLKHESMQE